ncbi:MAG: UDP-glucose/GDP-mannose dehydrogenase family protein [Chloroflexi bacterium]|nr:UDP-glucose/GDP-mannose dehydrogenase family protein [Chloroflexota bacterium]
MKVSVFGLGYVGCVTAACLADVGHEVTGVDINPMKVEAINKGHSPIAEPGLQDMIQRNRAMGRLMATADAMGAISRSDLSLICVGTPSDNNGQLLLDYVRRVTEDIGRALSHCAHYYVVVVRSTILPGVAQEEIIPLLERSSEKQAGRDFGLAVNPEFLREGSAIKDFQDPPFTVIGELNARSGDLVASLYTHLNTPLFRAPLGVAEMVKYASNAFHALKVTFANEIGNLCKTQGIDSHRVMDVFVTDTRLNLSPYYLRPGFAFGGSCLGKDLQALLHWARHNDLTLPVLEAILPSNNLQVHRALEMVIYTKRKKIGLLGLSFKAGTDDLRESRAIELVERLLGKGFDVMVYDQEVALGRIFGSNKAFIERVTPHIDSLMSDSLEEVVSKSEVVVIAKSLPEETTNLLFRLLRPDQVLIDLVRLDRQLDVADRMYNGICW